MIILILFKGQTIIDKVFTFTDDEEDIANEHKEAYTRQNRRAELIKPTQAQPVPFQLSIFDLELSS